eukprot:4379670-Pleurochrysis_carterae.AAC.1
MSSGLTVGRFGVGAPGLHGRLRSIPLERRAGTRPEEVRIASRSASLLRNPPLVVFEVCFSPCALVAQSARALWFGPPPRSLSSSSFFRPLSSRALYLSPFSPNLQHFAGRPLLCRSRARSHSAVSAFRVSRSQPPLNRSFSCISGWTGAIASGHARMHARSGAHECLAVSAASAACARPASAACVCACVRTPSCLCTRDRGRARVRVIEGVRVYA